jgi:hypothetical protein
MYNYKMAEYVGDREALRRDILRCKVPERNEQRGWRYPDLEKRSAPEVLKLTSVPYEAILAAEFRLPADALDLVQIARDKKLPEPIADRLQKIKQGLTAPDA